MKLSIDDFNESCWMKWILSLKYKTKNKLKFGLYWKSFKMTSVQIPISMHRYEKSEIALRLEDIWLRLFLNNVIFKFYLSAPTVPDAVFIGMENYVFFILLINCRRLSSWAAINYNNYTTIGWKIRLKIKKN